MLYPCTKSDLYSLLHRWIIVSTYLFQNSLRLFSLTTRVGQQGMPFGLLVDFPVLLKLNNINIFVYVFAKICSELLDPSFVFALDNGEKYSVQPMRFTALLKITRVKVNMLFSHLKKCRLETPDLKV